MRVVRDAAALAAAVGEWRAAGERVAVVPTMGYLHEGHLALVARARELAPRVVATIFVNPTQFAPHEDLGRYPRDEAGDIAKLEAAVDLMRDAISWQLVNLDDLIADVRAEMDP